MSTKKNREKTPTHGQASNNQATNKQKDKQGVDKTQGTTGEEGTSGQTQAKPSSPAATSSTAPTEPDGTQISSLINPPPEVAEATKMLNDMKATLDPLISVFDTITEKASQVAVLTEDTEIAKKIKRLQDDMKAQDDKHTKGIKEINDMIDDLLNVQIVAQLESEVEKIIEAEIDEMVKLQVAEDLKKHIPQEQQDELIKVKHELEEVQRALHNSESRRANAELRDDEPNSIINTIYRADGKISPLFPKDWKALFSLDGESCKKLLHEYGQANVSDSRERNLNRFITFCGLPYQVSINQFEDSVSYRSPTAVHHDFGSFRL